MDQIKSLVQQAVEKKYSSFDQQTKEVLKIKVAQKMEEQGYFDRLNQAKGISVTEGENPFAKKDDKEDKKEKDEEGEEEGKEKKEKKDKKENPFAKKEK